MVEIEFDPGIVSYSKLLKLFWEMHNPTTLNRQGPDIGSQYRSAIFYHNDAQRILAKASKENMNNSGKFSLPIVTEITEASKFYEAEQYHQEYLKKNGLSNCHI